MTSLRRPSVLVLTLALSFLLSVGASRELDDIPIIPADAHLSYCTAILGWYDGCSDPGNSVASDLKIPNTTFCDSAQYTPLDDPLFIDLDTCYTNPLVDEQSVSFFGETPDRKRIMEFHMIFYSKDKAEKSPLKPKDCNDVGVCTCTPELLNLKQQFLTKGGCSNTGEYACISEAFYGSNKECFMPASLHHGAKPEDIWCAMTAKVKQFGPCDTVLSIPEEAYQTYCTGITGWYDSCKIPDDDDDDICMDGSFFPLEKPLFIDLETCYVNPKQDGDSVSFFGLAVGQPVMEFHLMFGNTATAALYKPTNCRDNGACTCTDALIELKKKFLAANGCENGDGYTCLAEPWYGDTDRCFVPATSQFDDGLHCSMVARVEQFDPCDRTEFAQPTIPGATPPPTAAATAAATPPPTAATAVLTTPVPTPVTPPPSSLPPTAAATPPPPPSEAATPLVVYDDDDMVAFAGDIFIPPEAHGAFCTAIMGWYAGCLNPGPDAAEDVTICDNVDYHPLEAPLFFDINNCYSNPYMEQRSISFFGETPDRSKILEFHMIFPNNVTEPYGPLDCSDVGVCECSPTIKALKKQFLANGGCIDTDDYTCLSEDFFGDTDMCFVPATDMLGMGSTDLVCSMSANVQQFGPCDTYLEIPAPAFDTYCTAITGWYSACGDELDDDLCAAGDFGSLEQPLFIDLQTCYTNPMLNHHSVSFFGMGTDNVVKEFHVIFTKDAAEKYFPTNCQDDTGACECGKPLLDLKKKFLKDNKCGTSDEYSCLMEDWFGDTDRCFVPATADFGGDDGFFCSMVARVEQFDPCDPSVLGSNYTSGFRKSSGSGTSAGGVAGLFIAATILMICAVGGCFYFHRHGKMLLANRPAFLTRPPPPGAEDEDDVVWVRKGNRYKDVPEDTGDGVWKRNDVNRTRPLS